MLGKQSAFLTAYTSTQQRVSVMSHSAMMSSPNKSFFHSKRAFPRKRKETREERQLLTRESCQNNGRSHLSAASVWGLLETLVLGFLGSKYKCCEHPSGYVQARRAEANALVQTGEQE
jgi:hypothetical protein